VLGRSVCGAAHRRRGLPNQDALGWWPAHPDATAVVAVADGHGAAHCRHSADGSRLAVRSALEVLRELLGGPAPADPLLLAEQAQASLPQALTAHWRQAVRQHAGAGEAGSDEPYAAYGTTLLLAAVTPLAVLLLQVGDGDLLVVGHEGEVSRPLPRDARLVANETTSLCSATPGDFRCRVLDLREGPPALVLASTDGYANSFADDDAFRQVGRDLLALIRGEGAEAVEANLEGWLEETSEQGSGDDVTLGLLCRADLAGGVR
jgi:hypothetical protein